MDRDFNPYAAPLDSLDAPDDGGHDEDDDRAYRDGDLLMLPRFGGRLPKRCCVCNEKARKNELKRQLYWHPQWVTFLVLLSPIIYIIVSLVMRKSATVYVYLCDAHKRRRTNGGTLMVAGTLAAVVIGAVGQSVETTLLGTGLFFVAIIAGAVMMRTVVPTKMDDQYVWLKVGQPYLDSVRRSV
jgi:hypothetical protein